MKKALKIGMGIEQLDKLNIVASANPIVDHSTMQMEMTKGESALHLDNLKEYRKIGSNLMRQK